eukprot:305777-Chlamydomonas_euryale.AAC.1
MAAAVAASACRAVQQAASVQLPQRQQQRADLVNAHEKEARRPQLRVQKRQPGRARASVGHTQRTQNQHQAPRATFAHADAIQAQVCHLQHPLAGRSESTCQAGRQVWTWGRCDEGSVRQDGKCGRGGRSESTCQAGRQVWTQGGVAREASGECWRREAWEGRWRCEKAGKRGGEKMARGAHFDLSGGRRPT